MDQEKIGKFIAECRKENGYTQASLAEKLGITDRAISKWENGKSMPDASIMLELCELLKINVNELLTGEHIIMDNNYKEVAEKYGISIATVKTLLVNSLKTLRKEFSVYSGIFFLFFLKKVKKSFNRF